MKHHHFLILCLPLIALSARADIREPIPEDVLSQIAEETSGEAAKRTVSDIRDWLVAETGEVSVEASISLGAVGV